MVRVVIDYNPENGDVSVSAPGNMVMTFGILEMAKVALSKRATKKDENEPLVVPVGVIPNLRSQ